MKKIWLAFLLLATAAQAQFTIVFDYTYDSNQFFTGANAGRQTYLTAVGNYISNLLSSTSLNAITPGGGNTWNATFYNPGTGAAEGVSNPTYAANVYTIYAGGRALSGSTLGVGGAGGFNSSVFGNWSNDIRYRGNGTYSTSWGGSLSFDTETTWYFDSDINTVEDFTGKYDFFSVALHEIAHVLGLGTSASWTSLVSGSTFTGSHAVALAGGAPALATGDGHWAENTMSTIVGSGSSQETAMDPNIAANTRKYLTQLDLAGLQDIGYTAVPEPATIALLSGLGVLGFALLRRRFSS